MSNPWKTDNEPHPAYEATLAEPPPVAKAEAKPTGSLFNNGHMASLFTDTKAFRVGDVITVKLVERTQAKTQSATSADKSSGLSLAAPTLFGTETPALSASAAQGRNLSGSGNSSQSNQLDGELTVTVAKVMPNGNLMVRGEKRLTINQALEHLRISGLIRPRDVNFDNTVISTKVANAKFEYASKGLMNDVNKPGWASRFFFSDWWPL